MDIDSLSRLIESANVSSFRTLCVPYLKYIGFTSAQYCDGPYDGGRDFWLETDKDGKINCAIQLSVESDWKKKLKSEAIKVKTNYQTNVLYFISSRRIPEKTFQDYSREILKDHNVAVIRYDNQAIATEFIKRNAVKELLQIFGIDIKSEKHGIKKYLGPKNEAIASILIFGEDSKELRSGLYDSLIKSYLVKHKDGLSKDKLSQYILKDHSLSLPQEVIINSHIDRLLQKKEILKRNEKIILSKEEFDKFEGLIDSSEFEALQLKNTVERFLRNRKIVLSEKSKALIVDNIIELTVVLVSESFEHANKEILKKDLYNQIRTIIEIETSEQNVNRFFEELSKVVSETKYAKHIAGAQLYISLLNTDSSRLISALGGTESVNVYLDASVAIPLICNVLFSAQDDRSGTSSQVLFDLIGGHEFNAIVPDVYLEEMASHLIDACRDYKQILELGEDLSYSGNAFVSHYSNYKKSGSFKSITFENYVKVFGLNIKEIKHDMEYNKYFKIRDRGKNEISSLINRYSIETVEIPQKNPRDEISEINIALMESNLYRPDILVKHDAHVIKFLSGTNVSSGYAKVLCTWDKIQSTINPDARRGYFVLSPVAIIDLFSVAKRTRADYKFTHLVDFAKLQNEQSIMLSSKIWDKLAKIEKENFSDAELILKAKEFKEDYMTRSAIFEEVDAEHIATAWLAWKNQSKKN